MPLLLLLGTSRNCRGSQRSADCLERRLELEPSPHRDDAGTLLRTGGSPEIRVADGTVDSEIGPVEEVEDVDPVDKPDPTLPGQIDLLDDRDVLGEDRRLPESTHEL